MINVVGAPFAVLGVICDHAHQPVHTLAHINLKEQVKFDEVDIIEGPSAKVVPVDNIPLKEMIKGGLGSPNVSKDPQFDVG